MSWRDLTLAIANVVLLLALIPSILSKEEKPAIPTSLITAAALAAIVIVFLTLSLWFSAAVVSLTTALWLVLAVQQWRRHRDTAA